MFQKRGRNCERDKFRGGNGKPDPRHAPCEREQKNSRREQNAGAQKGQQCRNFPVREGGIERGGKDIDTAEQKGKGIRKDSLPREFGHRGVIGKETDDEGRQKGRGAGDEHGGAGDEHKAVLDDPAQHLAVPLAVIVADDRGHAHCVSHEQGGQNELQTHDDGDRCNAVLPHEFHHLNVEEKGRYPHGKIGDHLRRAVETASADEPQRALGFAEVQRTLFSRKEYEPGDDDDELSDPGRNRRAGDPESRVCDKDIVEDAVRDTGGDRQPHAKVRSPRSNEECGENHGENPTGREPERGAKVRAAVRKEFFRTSERAHNGLEKRQPDRRKQDSERDAHEHEKAEIAPRLLLFALSELAGDDRRTPRREHDTRAHDDVENRIDDIDRGERVRRDEPGDKDRIHNAI